MNIKFKNGFENSLFITYKSTENNIIIDREKNNYKKKDITIYIDNNEYGIARITTTESIVLFYSINWLLIEIWLKDDKYYENIAKIINNIIKDYDKVEYLIISINNKNINNISKLIKKNNFSKINKNDIIYHILKIDKNNSLFYLKFNNNNNILKESLKLYDFSEKFYDKENEFKILNINKTNKSYLLELNEKIFLLPYIKDKNNIKVLVKKDKNMFNNDILIPIKYKYKKNDIIDKDNDKHLLSESLKNNKIKLLNEDFEYEYIGEFFQNDNLDIKPYKFFIINITDKIDNDIKDEETDDSIITMPLKKALKDSKSTTLNNMLLYLFYKIAKDIIRLDKINNIIIKKDNNIDNNEEEKIDENFSASMASYESIETNKKPFKDEYPESIIKNSIEIIKKNKKYN